MTQNEAKLDLELLEEMAGLGIEDLRELIDAYLEQATEGMQKICSAIDAKNADEVADLAHRLAGSSAVCGMTSAMNMLRMLEQSGCKANWPAIEMQEVQAIREIESNERLVRDYLGEKNQKLRGVFVPPAIAQMSHS